MAPEIIEGKHFSGKADVYSFGIMMFEILTDSTPYPSLESGKINEFNFNKKVVENDYRPKINFPIKKSIKKLMTKCWSKNPNERPTFEEIFYMLAYNIENSVDIYDDDDYDYDDNEEEEDLEEKYSFIEEENKMLLLMLMK